MDEVGSTSIWWDEWRGEACKSKVEKREEYGGTWGGTKGFSSSIKTSVPSFPTQFSSVKGKFSKGGDASEEGVGTRAEEGPGWSLLAINLEQVRPRFSLPLSRGIAIAGEGKKTREPSTTNEWEEKASKKNRKPEGKEKANDNT
jgi:hypothetical protein